MFGKGNGVLNAAVRDEIINRRRAREAKEAEAVSNSKKKPRDLQSQVKNVRKGMRKQGEKFKHTINSLKPLVRWKMASSAYKKEKKDAIPTKKADLLDKYEKIKSLPSPQVSPWNSENEDESNGEVSESEEEERLVFDSDESDSDESCSDESGSDESGSEESDSDESDSNGSDDE